MSSRSERVTLKIQEEIRRPVGLILIYRCYITKWKNILGTSPIPLDPDRNSNERCVTFNVTYQFSSYLILLRKEICITTATRFLARRFHYTTLFNSFAINQVSYQEYYRRSFSNSHRKSSLSRFP